ncbi:MAG TPA: hypothetical protein VHZ02_03580, partial [Acidimicrobiales bacterium]|nr:hypothetical protein [Acidimicrobiales bacterium]
MNGDGPVSKLSERLWSGSIDISGPDHPVQATGFISEEISPGVLVYLSLASATAIETGEGLVLLDSGGPFDVAPLYDHVRAW